MACEIKPVVEVLAQILLHELHLVLDVQLQSQSGHDFEHHLIVQGVLLAETAEVRNYDIFSVLE